MDEQLISFDTAVLAKEKGFNLIVNRHYSGLGNHLLKTKTYHNFNEEVGVSYSAPTRSLLQKWIREEYNMHILMQVGMNDGTKQTFYCNVFKFGKNLYKSKFRSKTSIYTYEEALEIGLQEALKLINQ